MSFPTVPKIQSVVPMAEEIDAALEELVGIINGGLDADNVRRGVKLDTWLETYSVQHYSGSWVANDTVCMLGALPTMPSYSGASFIEYATRCWAVMFATSTTAFGTLTFSYDSGSGLTTFATLTPSSLRQVPVIGSSLVAHFGWAVAPVTLQTGPAVAFSVSATAPAVHSYAGVAVKALNRD